MVLYSQAIVAAWCCAEQLKVSADVSCVTRLFPESVLDSHRFLFTCKETRFYCEGDQALVQVSQGGCGVSAFENIQKPSDTVLGNWL